jgi:NAD(P)-dependent dehydrogenase (short-subunit alcohol dehydrogenase family)
VERRRPRHLGRVDILVNNAGITHAREFLDLAEE